jgi:hypothetical protein
MHVQKYFQKQMMAKPCKPFLKTNPCYPVPANAHQRTDAIESPDPMNHQIAIVYKTNPHQRLNTIT